jgi:putative transposase
MTRKRYSTDLTDAEWEQLAPLVQRMGTMGRPVKLDLREIVNALFYWARTGCQWRLLPNDFPNWTSVRYYFDKWEKDGTWERINKTVRREMRIQSSRTVELSADLSHNQAINSTPSNAEDIYDLGKKPQDR